MRPVPDWDPSPWFGRKDARHTDRFAQFAVAAADLALADGGLAAGDVDPERAGVHCATGMGGLATFETAVLDRARARRRPRQPVQRPDDHAQRGGGGGVAAARLAGAVRDGDDRLRGRHPRRRRPAPGSSRRASATSCWPAASDASLVAHHAGRLHATPGAHEPHRRQPAVRRRPRRVRGRGGRGAAAARAAGRGAGPRRAGLRGRSRARPAAPTPSTSPPPRRAAAGRRPACGGRSTTPV